MKILGGQKRRLAQDETYMGITSKAQLSCVKYTLSCGLKSSHTGIFKLYERGICAVSPALDSTAFEVLLRHSTSAFWKDAFNSYPFKKNSCHPYYNENGCIWPLGGILPTTVTQQMLFFSNQGLGLLGKYECLRGSIYLLKCRFRDISASLHD